MRAVNKLSQCHMDDDESCNTFVFRLDTKRAIDEQFKLITSNCWINGECRDAAWRFAA